MGDINWFGGSGQTNPASDSFVSDKIAPPKTAKQNSVGADVWAGMSPRGEVPVNKEIEISNLDDHAGAKTEARQAVMNGVKIALIEIPNNLNTVTYREASGGVYEIIESSAVIGYASEIPKANN